ncbi:(2Fe-2S)-binding protein [Kitasatospora cineracea]|uniref:(2Fe-2S)-binding protein n=1 Tax=Kitasatospora cineracea TaxID=88074 RepID=UPI0033DE9E52
MDIVIHVDGQPCHADAQGAVRLLDFLRDSADSKSVKSACVSASCGACTVLLDGRSIRSCTVVTGQADGHSVTTVASTPDDALLRRIQDAFVEFHATQCGFCSPGMVMAALSLLREQGELDEESIRRGLRGNVCRCVGYPAILRAMLSLSSMPSDEHPLPPAPDSDHSSTVRPAARLSGH